MSWLNDGVIVAWKRFAIGLKVVLSLFLIATPIAFFWVTELVMTPNGTQLTNGFMIFDGLKNYHIAMYSLFLTNFIAAFLIIASEIKESSQQPKEGTREG